MAPSARVLAAYKAMAEIGIPQQRTKVVLKRLMKAYDKNWTVIEEENYRLLADSIFEDDDATTSGTEKNAENTDQRNASAVGALQQDGSERPSKRSRGGQDASNGGQSTTTAGAGMVMEPKPELIGGARDCSAPSGSETFSKKNKGKQPISAESPALPGLSEPAKPNGRTSRALRLKEPDKESGGGSASKRKEPVSGALIIPKEEPHTDDIPPLQAPVSKKRPEPLHLLDSGPPNANGSPASQTHVQPSASERVNGIKRKRKMPSSSVEEQENAEGEDIPGKSLASLEIATSSLGEVKVSLSYDSILDRPNLRLPSLDEIIKHMEDKHLGSLKAVVPSFSFPKLMRDFCDCFLEVTTSSSSVSPERSLDHEPASESCKKSAAQGIMVNDGREGSPSMLPPSLIEEIFANCFDNEDEAAVSVSIDSRSQDQGINCPVVNKEFVGDGERDANYVQDSNAQSLAVVEQQPLDLDVLRCIYDAADLTRGEEKVKVPLLSESNSGSLPSFHYMSHNVVYCDAHVKILLARIGDKDCCPVCNGDCLSSSSQCTCLCKNGEGFAYTSDGLVKEEFLEECMSVVQNPQKHQLFECSVCPLEKCKGEDLSEPCKGHLKRKFIKECWSKCGCAKICANRVVQRGISCKLEVFWTPQGKGWGLRTLDELPRGAFVCEYVGEVLTISELHQRNSKKKNNEKHSYAAILDAGWGSGDLQDNQNLCLDSTLYGNIARFINHRCLDANLVEIPVQIETTDRHYYHVALFTTRKVDPLEELTWDYRIDFDDEENHLKTFKCLCGSSFCRDMKRSNTSLEPGVSSATTSLSSGQAYGLSPSNPPQTSL